MSASMCTCALARQFLNVASWISFELLATAVRAEVVVRARVVRAMRGVWSDRHSTDGISVLACAIHVNVVHLIYSAAKALKMGQAFACPPGQAVTNSARPALIRCSAEFLCSTSASLFSAA